MCKLVQNKTGFVTEHTMLQHSTAQQKRDGDDVHLVE